ncbi:uncharacterized protein V6R79_018243 [Siganus canaliculatus]
MSRRLTKEELDEQFELFLKESVSDDSLDLGSLEKQPGAKPEPKSAQKPTWWEDDKLSEHGAAAEMTRSRFIKAKKSQNAENDGMLGMGKTFKKTLRESESIQEEEEDPGDAGIEEERQAAASISAEVEAMAADPSNIGLDTLEEEEEKARFFAQLEAGDSATIDYSKLNREFDPAGSTTEAELRNAVEAVEQRDCERSRVPETRTESPVSPQYSEDFEEEEHERISPEEKTTIPQILAKVSLYDSLDDTGGGSKKMDSAGSLDRGQSCGGSDVEAVHEAYRQIHVVEDSEGLARHFPAQEEGGSAHGRQSLQPASTAESDYPTAEELMRPIRPEEAREVRGFSLQPVSAVEQHGEKRSHLLEKTFLHVTSPEFELKQTGETDCTAGQGGSFPDPSKHNQTWTISQQVERLMQDQNTHSTHTGKAKTQTPSHSARTVGKKPTVAPVRGRRVEGRPIATPRSSGPSKAAAAARNQSAVSQLSQLPQAESGVKDDYTAEPGVDGSGELLASGQSVFTLQQAADSSSQQDAAGTQQDTLTHLPRHHKEEEHSLVQELRLLLAHKDRELQAMKEEAAKLNSLKQHNFLLQSKLRSAEEPSEKRWAKSSDLVVGESLQQMEKELKEQEVLLKGYQQENEKLYLQVKAQQVMAKSNEEAMFNENQRLLNELAFTRQQINKTSQSIGNVCSMDHTQRISGLLAQINIFQRNEAKLLEENHRLKQEKQALDVDLQLLKKERDLAAAQATSASDDKTFERRVLEDKHREEVAAMKKKLQWFAENQELLDRDAGRLKAATAEIHRLKEQVETLKTEVSRSSSEQQRKAKVKGADTKRIQELERQVRELEQILRHRNPNSLPALLYAAATAGDGGDGEASKTSPPSRINALLERRIQRLEAELEGRDEEAKRSLRAMEQQFLRIKLRYEQQISERDQQAAASAAGAEQWTPQLQTVQEELQRVKEQQQEKEKSLLDQIQSLQQQLKHKTPPSPGRHQRQAEEAYGTRIARLNQELSAKTRSIQELTRTVESLQRERRSILSVSSPPTESRRPPGPAKRPSPAAAAAAGEACGAEEAFPAAHCDKTYQPTIFTGSHISEVLQENSTLRQQMELLELQSERDKQAMKAETERVREELRRLQESSAGQLVSMRAEHLRELEQLRAAHALEHSSSKCAQLANELNTQETIVKHLQDQLKELQGAKEALAISRTREDALQKQLTRLLKELKEARDAQSPEVKLLRSLEKKIVSMELRHEHREKELQQVIGVSWQPADVEQQSEVEHWKRLAQDKSREMESFRLELDSILDILKHLQRQGVVFPFTAPTSQIS